jgi:hypothetical protein
MMEPMRRFVVLRHTMPSDASRQSHWDLMFDVGDTGLKTWAVNEAPDTCQEQPADQLADHRAMYLDYEGEVFPDRGHVARWDEGTHQVLAHDAEQLQLHLLGARLRGIATFTMENSAWRLRFEAEGEVAG